MSYFPFTGSTVLFSCRILVIIDFLQMIRFLWKHYMISKLFWQAIKGYYNIDCISINICKCRGCVYLTRLLCTLQYHYSLYLAFNFIVKHWICVCGLFGFFKKLFFFILLTSQYFLLSGMFHPSDICMSFARNKQKREKETWSFWR